MIGTFLFFTYLFWNVFCFFLMFADKQKAINEKYRISEKTLLKFALCFGAFSIAFGMMAFTHKKKKNKFVLTVGLGIFLNIACILLLLRIY